MFFPMFPMLPMYFQFPSGNVSQDGMFENFFSPRFYIGAGDPVKERRITQEVASYGTQLGIVLDALDVLIRHLEPALKAGHGEALKTEGDKALKDGSPEDLMLERLKVLRADVESKKRNG